MGKRHPTTRPGGHGRAFGWGLAQDTIEKRQTFVYLRDKPTLIADTIEEVPGVIDSYAHGSRVRQNYKWHIYQRDGVWWCFVY